MAAMTSSHALKVLPSGDCRFSVCPAHMQQRPPVSAVIVHLQSCMFQLLVSIGFHYLISIFTPRALSS